MAAISICGYLVRIYGGYDFQKQWLNLIATQFGNKGLEAVASGRLTLRHFCEEPGVAGEAACQKFELVLLLQNSTSRRCPPLLLQSDSIGYIPRSNPEGGLRCL